MASNEIEVTATSAFVHEGNIVPAGGQATVTERMAKDLLRRGKVELTTGTWSPPPEKPKANSKKPAPAE